MWRNPGSPPTSQVRMKKGVCLRYHRLWRGRGAVKGCRNPGSPPKTQTQLRMKTGVCLRYHRLWRGRGAVKAWRNPGSPPKSQLRMKKGVCLRYHRLSRRRGAVECRNPGSPPKTHKQLRMKTGVCLRCHCLFRGRAVMECRIPGSPPKTQKHLLRATMGVCIRYHRLWWRRGAVKGCKYRGSWLHLRFPAKQGGKYGLRVLNRTKDTHNLHFSLDSGLAAETRKWKRTKETRIVMLTRVRRPWNVPVQFTRPSFLATSPIYTWRASFHSMNSSLVLVHVQRQRSCLDTVELRGFGGRAVTSISGQRLLHKITNSRAVFIWSLHSRWNCNSTFPELHVHCDETNQWKWRRIGSAVSLAYLMLSTWSLYYSRWKSWYTACGVFHETVTLSTFMLNLWNKDLFPCSFYPLFKGTMWCIPLETLSHCPPLSWTSEIMIYFPCYLFIRCLGILERSDDSLSETLEKENLCESGGEDRREEVLTSSPSKGARGKKKRTAAGTKDAADKAASNTMPTKRISQDVSPNQSPAKKRKSSENIVEGVSCENWEASMRKGVVTSIANNTLNQQTEDVVAESKNVAGRKDSGKRKRNRKGKDVNRGALSHENNEENLGAGADCPPRSRDCETGWESVAGETVANSVNGNRKKAKKKPRNWARTDTRRVSEELSVEQDAGVQDGNNMKRSNTDEVVDDQGGNPGCQTEWETVAEESADDGKKRKKEKRERKQARKRPVSDSSDRHSRDITGENSTQNVNAREEKNECNNLQKGNLDYQSQRETVFEDSDGGSKDGTADKPNKKKRRKKKKEQRAVPNEWLSDKPRTMADVSAMNGRSKVNVNWVVDQEHSIKNPGNQSSWESCVVDARGSEGGTEKRKKKPRRKTKSLEKDMSTEEGFRGDLAASERHIVKVDKRATKRIQPSAIGKTVERSNPKRRPPSSEKQQGGSVVEDSGYDGETSRENLEVKKRSVMHRGRGTDLLPAQGKTTEKVHGGQRTYGSWPYIEKEKDDFTAGTAKRHTK